MFKKLNIRILAIVLVGLIAIWIISSVISSRKGDRSFKSELAIIDTANVTVIEFYPNAENKEQVRLVRAVKGWDWHFKGQIAKADTNIMKNMLASFANLKAERVAADDKLKWSKFDVTDSLGVNVKVMEDEHVSADMIIGRYSYKQPTNQYDRQGTISTYLRLQNEERVYAVEGFLSMMFNNNANSYRDKTLLSVNAEDISRLSFQYPGDSSFNLVKNNNVWLVNSVPADSTKVQNYLNSIANLSSYEFINNPNISQPSGSLKIEGNNFLPVDIIAYTADTVHKFFITSSLNKGAVFSGSKNNLFDQVFVGPRRFIAKE